jgi:hypothetical protein
MRLRSDANRRWKQYRERDWPTYLRDEPRDNPAGIFKQSEFEEYRAMAADRQARALLRATWTLVLATVGLGAVTIALVVATVHGSH